MITKEQWKEITDLIRKFRHYHYKVYFNGKEITICPEDGEYFVLETKEIIKRENFQSVKNLKESLEIKISFNEFEKFISDLKIMEFGKWLK